MKMQSLFTLSKQNFTQNFTTLHVIYEQWSSKLVFVMQSDLELSLNFDEIEFIECLPLCTWSCISRKLKV